MTTSRTGTATGSNQTFEPLEALLAEQPATGRFCHGDRPGLADLCLVPQVVNNRRYQLDMAPYPTISRIAEACLALPAFRRAAPESQPGRGIALQMIGFGPGTGSLGGNGSGTGCGLGPGKGSGLGGDGPGPGSRAFRRIEVIELFVLLVGVTYLVHRLMHAPTQYLSRFQSRICERCQRRRRCS